MEGVSRLGSRLWPQLHWRVRTQAKAVFLTFDDGPTPGATPFVLEQLAAYGAHATFFCLGKQADLHPQLLRQAAAVGHTIGHHSYHHLHGWYTGWLRYLSDVEAGKASVEHAIGAESRLFRPPYGRFPLQHVYELHARHPMVLWDVLTGDYRKRFSPQKCLLHTLRHVRPGSIVLLHDSQQAEANLRALLPTLLAELAARGYAFQGLKDALA